MWSYRVKLYDSAEFPVLGFTVDCSAGVSGRDAVVVRAGTSLAGEGDSLPVTVYCEVWRGGPVVGAAVSVLNLLVVLGVSPFSLVNLLLPSVRLVLVGSAV